MITNIVKFAALFVASLISFSAVAAKYEVIDLGSLGGDLTDARAISETSKITGWSRIAPDSIGDRAFLWDKGAMIDLGTLNGSSNGYDINDIGEVVGTDYMHLDGGGVIGTAFIWRDGEMISLGTLGGDRSHGSSINEYSQVVGISKTSNDQFHAFIWQDGIMQDIGALAGGHSGAMDINNAGQVTGNSSTTPILGNMRAFIWDSVNGMRSIGTLGGNSFGMAINNHGHIVGYSSANYRIHAFFWDGEVMHDLGAPQGRGNALGINDFDQIVGRTGLSSSYRAAYWEDGIYYDLNTLIPEDSGWVLHRADDINNKGEIVGYGTYNGETRGFLLVPTADTDGDGIRDYVDQCPNSDTRETVVVQECATSAPNVLDNDGCKISDHIISCELQSINHGKNLACVSDVTDRYELTGLMTAADSHSIHVCVAKSNHP